MIFNSGVYQIKNILSGHVYMSEGNKKLLADRMRGNTNSLGKTLTEEQKKKISERSKGNKHSTGFKNHLGMKVSDEGRKHMSEAGKCRKPVDPKRYEIRSAAVKRGWETRLLRKAG